MKEIAYHYRSLIERGTGAPGYVWKEGYSANGPEGGILYPWNTRAECRAVAKAEGARAVFYRDGERETRARASRATKWDSLSPEALRAWKR